MGANFTTPNNTDKEGFQEDDTCSPPGAKRARIEPECSASRGYDFNYIRTHKPWTKSSPIAAFERHSQSVNWWMPVSYDSTVYTKPPWDRLPCVALMEVFRCLSASDKLNASLACRSWQLPFTRPALWRRGRFRFNGEDDWRALCYASMMGDALRHVTIDCSILSSDAKYKPSQIRSSAEKLTIFFTTLINSNNCQIYTFALTNMARLERHFGKPGTDVIPLLSRFLTSQSLMTSFDLGFACLTADDAYQVLDALVVTCGNRLQVLSIPEVIRPTPGYEAWSDPRLFTLVAGFKSLREIHLSNRMLSDDLLFLLASTVSATLTQISVSSGPRQVGLQYGRTTIEAWRHIKHRCSNLQASFNLEDVCLSRCFKEMLVPFTPLTRLQWRSHRFETLINIKVCLQHIRLHFSESLRYLTLDLHAAFLKDEADIENIVDDCLRLESLTIETDPAPLPQRMCIERAVRRAVARQPRTRLIDVTVNGRRISLDESWMDLVVGWLVRQVE